VRPQSPARSDRPLVDDLSTARCARARLPSLNEQEGSDRQRRHSEMLSCSRLPEAGPMTARATTPPSNPNDSQRAQPARRSLRDRRSRRSIVVRLGPLRSPCCLIDTAFPNNISEQSRNGSFLLGEYPNRTVAGVGNIDPLP